MCVYILYLVGAEQLSSSQDDKTLLWPTERGFYNLSRPFCRRKRFNVYQQSKWAPTSLPLLSSLSPSISGFIFSPSCSLIEKRYSKRCSGEVLRSLISQLKGINCKRETREETNDLLALSLPPFLHSALVYAFLWSTILGPPQTSWKNNTKDSSSGSFLLKKQRNKVTKVLKTSLHLFCFI